MTTLNPSTITPESLQAAAQRHGLRLMPNGFFHFARGSTRVVGCCAEAALAIEADPTVLGENFRVSTVLAKRGLSSEFRAGLRQGFEGEPRAERLKPEAYNEGFAVGRETRRLAGIDPGPGGTP